MITLSLCSCTDTPAVAPSQSSTKAPAAFVLHGEQLRGYKEQANITVTRAALADQDKDPTIATALASEGFQTGARTTFVDPGTTAPTTAFATVFSQALFFDSGGGATRFFGEEVKRRQVAPQAGASMAVLPTPAAAVDQIISLQVTVPPATPGDPAERAYFGVIRKGRVLASVFANGDARVATAGQFMSLLTQEESLLQRSPD